MQSQCSCSGISFRPACMTSFTRCSTRCLGDVSPTLQKLGRLLCFFWLTQNLPLRRVEVCTPSQCLFAVHIGQQCMVLESRGQPCRCRVSSKLEGAVFRFTFHTSSECVRVFLDAGASSDCSTVWTRVPNCMVCMCVLGMSSHSTARHWISMLLFCKHTLSTRRGTFGEFMLQASACLHGSRCAPAPMS